MKISLQMQTILRKQEMQIFHITTATFHLFIVQFFFQNPYGWSYWLDGLCKFHN